MNGKRAFAAGIFLTGLTLVGWLAFLSGEGRDRVDQWSYVVGAVAVILFGLGGLALGALSGYGTHHADERPTVPVGSPSSLLPKSASADRVALAHAALRAGKANEAARLLTRLPPMVAARLVSDQSPVLVASILMRMTPGHAAQILDGMSMSARARVSQLMQGRRC